LKFQHHFQPQHLKLSKMKIALLILLKKITTALSFLIGSFKMVHIIRLTTFDVSSIGGQDIIDLFSEEVVTSSFASFDFQIKKLAGKIKTELDSFYSTDSNPKPTGKMTSTERHYLAAIVAKEYPQLITRYQEFKEQHRKGEDLGRMIYATTFKSNFMDFFISKLNNKEKHVPKRLLELNGPRELKKKKVSEAMKISAKEFPRPSIFFVSLLD
ncbi:hypothetical protein TYRP_001008, partial [Tyrophagus putrescentiae]